MNLSLVWENMKGNSSELLGEAGLILLYGVKVKQNPGAACSGDHSWQQPRGVPGGPGAPRSIIQMRSTRMLPWR